MRINNSKTTNMQLLELARILSSTDQMIELLRGKAILQDNMQCVCNKQMSEQHSTRYSDGHIFRCSRCKKAATIRKGSIFQGCNLELWKLTGIIYLMALEVSQHNICEALDLSASTVIMWQDRVRNSYSRKLLQDDEKLGGPGRIVEVDESLISKQKVARSGRARPVRQRWVIGLFDRQSKIGSIELVEDRSAATLLPIIQRYCLPGATIYTDAWAAYDGLGALGFVHRRVVHEREFVVPGTDIHTNNVESYWSRCKAKFKRIRGRNDEMVASYLDEFMWSERYGVSVSHRFENTLSCLVQYKYSI